MRILYGVVGEGMGHAMRSRVVLDHLRTRHEIHVVVSGRAHDYLAGRASETLGLSRIFGASIVYEDNEVRKLRTLLANVKGALRGWPKNVRTYFEVARAFAPDVVISDFESWSTLFAKNHHLPLVSLDNMQVIDRCTHARALIAGHRGDFELTRAIVRAKVPRAFHYLVTTFFRPPLRKARTSLHPPILRPEILDAKREPGDHLLVYQTSTSNKRLPEILARCRRECRIYGMRRGIEHEEVEGNLRHRPFSEQGFIDDLRTAAGVVASAGFTLMGEAVSLGKPMLAVPVRGQFEQILNARYLESAGYGLCVDELDAGALGRFVERLPDFEARLSAYRQDGNRDLLAALDGVLARAT